MNSRPLRILTRAFNIAAVIYLVFGVLAVVIAVGQLSNYGGATATQNLWSGLTGVFIAILLYGGSALIKLFLKIEQNQTKQIDQAERLIEQQRKLTNALEALIMKGKVI